MKRLIAAITLVLAVIAVQPAGAVVLEQKKGHHRPCQYPWWKGPEARKDLILCLSRVRDAPGSPPYVLSIARCESGPDLQAGVGSHAGTFQHTTSAWPGRVRSFESWAQMRQQYVPPTNVRMNTAVAVWMAKSDGSWSQEWSCA